MINQSLIESQISSLLDSTATLELAEAKAQFKSQLATIIVNAIKSAQLTIPSGAVAVAGTASNQTNPAPIVVTSGLS